jgi:hypothetical protein
MASPEWMRCLRDECPTPLRCNDRGSCREITADVWRSVALGFEVCRARGDIPKAWMREVQE